MEGNVEHALFYATHEFREEWGDRLHSVPDEDDPIFGYGTRLDILRAMSDLHHAGFVIGNFDALNYVDQMIDRIPRSGVFRPREHDLVADEGFGWFGWAV